MVGPDDFYWHYQHPCNTCEGSGREGLGHLNPCHACGGMGVVSIEGSTTNGDFHLKARAWINSEEWAEPHWRSDVVVRNLRREREEPHFGPDLGHIAWDDGDGSSMDEALRCSFRFIDLHYDEPFEPYDSGDRFTQVFPA